MMIIKAILDDSKEARHLQVPGGEAGTCFDRLHAELTRVWPTAMAGASIGWKDADGDFVTVSDSSDVLLAVKGQADRKVVSFVVKPSNKANLTGPDGEPIEGDLDSLKAAVAATKLQAELAQQQAKLAKFRVAAAHPKYAMGIKQKGAWGVPHHGPAATAAAAAVAGAGPHPKHAHPKWGAAAAAGAAGGCAAAAGPGGRYHHGRHGGFHHGPHPKWAKWRAHAADAAEVQDPVVTTGTAEATAADAKVHTGGDDNSAAAAAAVAPTAGPMMPLLDPATQTPVRGAMMRVAKAPRLEARFVKDVTAPAGTSYAPSTPFTKTWRLRNDGEVAWPEGTVLLFVSPKQSRLGAKTDRVPIPAGAGQPGEEVDVSVDMVAPALGGDYQGFWRLLNTTTGRRFGQRLKAAIHVADDSSSSSTDASSSESDSDDIATDETAAAAASAKSPAPNDSWAAKLKELESMGFDNRKQNVRLLVRFSGDLDQVIERLLRQRQRRAGIRAQKQQQQQQQQE